MRLGIDFDRKGGQACAVLRLLTERGNMKNLCILFTLVVFSFVSHGEKNAQSEASNLKLSPTQEESLGKLFFAAIILGSVKKEIGLSKEDLKNCEEVLKIVKGKKEKSEKEKKFIKILMKLVQGSKRLLKVSKLLEEEIGASVGQESESLVGEEPLGGKLKTKIAGLKKGSPVVARR